MSDLSTARLDALRATALPAPAVDALARHLATADDVALFRMSPLRFAAEHGLDERVGIDLFLHATHVGLLDFTWGVLCPGCAAFLTSAANLRALAERRHCELCEIDIEGTLDDHVEVAFTVAPSVRRIRFHDPSALKDPADLLRIFFSSSVELGGWHEGVPRYARGHARPAPGESSQLARDLPAGHYVVIAPELHAVTRVELAAGAPTASTLELLDAHFLSKRTTIGVGSAVSVHNRSARPVLLALLADPTVEIKQDRTCDPPGKRLRPFLSGKRLLTSQVFAQLFRSESVPASGLALKSLTLLFTDLKGSTEMYARIGDLRAYDLVRRHFHVLEEIVAARGGAIVKTIGDAIMASFADAAPALDAALAMNREVREIREAKEGELLLKIGIHSGPCIAVDLNERLDYFGQTVNLAARVQGIADGSEIVCTEAVWAAPGVAARVHDAGLAIARESTQLKGIAGETPVVRLR